MFVGRKNFKLQTTVNAIDLLLGKLEQGYDSFSEDECLALERMLMMLRQVLTNKEFVKHAKF